MFSTGSSSRRKHFLPPVPLRSPVPAVPNASCICLICANVFTALHFGGVRTDRDRSAERTSRRADFELSMDDLRTVAAFSSTAAEMVLPHFEARCPDDGRPRQALESAQAFVLGDPRSKTQRVSAPAHAIRIVELMDSPNGDVDVGSPLELLRNQPTPAAEQP